MRRKERMDMIQYCPLEGGIFLSLSLSQSPSKRLLKSSFGSIFEKRILVKDDDLAKLKCQAF
jgi:hypothetical protein